MASRNRVLIWDYAEVAIREPGSNGSDIVVMLVDQRPRIAERQWAYVAKNHLGQLELWTKGPKI